MLFLGTGPAQKHRLGQKVWDFFVWHRTHFVGTHDKTENNRKKTKQSQGETKKNQDETKAEPSVWKTHFGRKLISFLPAF